MAADSLWHLEAVTLGPARLRAVSLIFQPGVTAVIGWSGAGKTSLLNLLAGFERPDSGTMAREPKVAWVPQSGGLWPHCTARAHLEIARRSPAGIDEMLAAFDLTERAHARPYELSQGEQSRLAVARALVTPADVLVMDEPLVHVDPARAGKYWQVIRDHLHTTAASLVFSSHVPETVLGEAERVVCLREGRVLHEGLVADLYARPSSAELMGFLGPGNWLTPEEARQWLGLESVEPSCFRPEQIVIQPSSNGGVVLESTRFRGSFAESSLRQVGQNLSRTFYHRPTARLSGAGQPVTLCAS